MFNNERIQRLQAIKTNAYGQAPTDIASYIDVDAGALFVLKELRGKKILEIGMNKGFYAALLKKMRGAIVFGVDPNAIAGDIARKLGVIAICGSSSDLPFPSGTFDAVITNTVLNPYPGGVNSTSLITASIREIFRVLKPNGWYISRNDTLDYASIDGLFSRSISLETPDSICPVEMFRK